MPTALPCCDNRSSLFLSILSGLSGADPFVDLRDLELPQSSNLVRRETSIINPSVDRVFAYAQVPSNVVKSYPRLTSHGIDLSNFRPTYYMENQTIAWKTGECKSKIRPCQRRVKMYARQISAESRSDDHSAGKPARPVGAKAPYGALSGKTVGIRNDELTFAMTCSEGMRRLEIARAIRGSTGHSPVPSFSGTLPRASRVPRKRNVSAPGGERRKGDL